MNNNIPSGICRHCGCTYERACRYQELGLMRSCSWRDIHFTLCSNPECVKWARQFTLPALEALRSRRCVCGCRMQEKKGICRDCFHATPWEIAGRLYKTHSEGFALYYFDCLRYLCEKTMRLAHVDDAELLRLIAESAGTAGKAAA